MPFGTTVLVLESADKAFRFHIGGRLEFDNTWYQQTQDLALPAAGRRGHAPGRLAGRRRIGETIDFVTEVNFANIQDVTNEDSTTQIGSVGLTDFYVDFKQIPSCRTSASATSRSRSGWNISPVPTDWYYMERSPGHDAFLQPFNYVTGMRFSIRTGTIGSPPAVAFDPRRQANITPFAFGAGPGEYAVTGRLTCLPFYADEGRRLLHLGIGYSYSGTDKQLLCRQSPSGPRRRRPAGRSQHHLHRHVLYARSCANRRRRNRGGPGQILALGGIPACDGHQHLRTV